MTVCVGDRNEGGCLCGGIRYAVTGPSVWQSGCCCRSCVLAHSAPYVVWAGFDVSNFTFLRDEPSVFRSSPDVLRSFCPRCGTSLTYRKDAAADIALTEAASVVYISVPTLDRPELFPPTEVVRYAERVCWLELAPTVPLREGLSGTASHLQVRTTNL